MKPATMRYFDAIHAQLDALASWKANHWEYSIEVANGASELLQRADPYFLDGDIQQWIMDGVASFPHDIRIGDVLPPSRMGWILFERPIPHPLATTDEEQITCPGWAALAWSTIDHRREPDLVHCPYHDPDMTKKPSLSVLAKQDGGIFIRCVDGCNMDDVVRAMRERGYDQQLHDLSNNINDEPPVVTLDYYHRTHDHRLVLQATQSWPFHEDLQTWDMAELMKVEAGGSEVHGAQGFAKDVDAAAHRAAMIERAFVISLFAFMNQPFATVESRRLPRANRRSLHRETALDDPHIKVITLRRTQHTNGQSEGGSREWACRWLVKGHWRSQYYPGAKTNKPLWIMPYVKGPQDKPLKRSNGIALYHVTR